MALIEGKRGLGIGLRLAIAFSLALSAVWTHAAIEIGVSTVGSLTE